jgi:hypothetical protein
VVSFPLPRTVLILRCIVFVDSVFMNSRLGKNEDDDGMNRLH